MLSGVVTASLCVVVRPFSTPFVGVSNGGGGGVANGLLRPNKATVVVAASSFNGRGAFVNVEKFSIGWPSPFAQLDAPFAVEPAAGWAVSPEVPSSDCPVIISPASFLRIRVEVTN